MGEISKNYLYNSEIFATFAAVLSVNNEFNYSQFNHFRYEKDFHFLIGIAIE